MKKVLLIEDDPFLTDIYTTKLKEAGYSVTVAADGEEGLKKVKEEKPDLLLLDIVIPIIDGWELIKKIKKNKNMSNFKIIILSNLGQKSEVEKGIKLGVTKYLIKAHYSPSEVIKEIEKVLK